MNWNELAESVDQWQDHEAPPLDGTPILIDQGGVLGVYPGSGSRSKSLAACLLEVVIAADR